MAPDEIREEFLPGCMRTLLRISLDIRWVASPSFSASSSPSASTSTSHSTTTAVHGACSSHRPLPPAQPAPRVKRQRTLPRPPGRPPGEGASSSAAPPPSPPGSPAPQLAQQLGDVGFVGDYKGATWNSQALLAAAPSRREAKLRYLEKLLRTNDFAVLTESHSTLALALAAALGWAVLDDDVGGDG